MCPTDNLLTPPSLRPRIRHVTHISINNNEPLYGRKKIDSVCCGRNVRKSCDATMPVITSYIMHKVWLSLASALIWSALRSAHVKSPKKFYATSSRKNSRWLSVFFLRTILRSVFFSRS